MDLKLLQLLRSMRSAMNYDATMLHSFLAGADQSDFLNRVIVDQQSKIELLNGKIKDLEEMLLNGEVERVEDAKWVLKTNFYQYWDNRAFYENVD